MAIKTIDDNNLTNIANAIREKNGTTETYKPSEMADAILEIESATKYAPSYIQFRNFPGNDLDYETLNLDASNLTRMVQMFYSCTNLTSLKLAHLDTRNVGYLTQMCYGCTKLTSVDGLDASGVNIVANPFSGCTKLENLGALKNLGKSFPTTSSANYGNHTLILSQSTQLTRNSLLAVINGLYDIKSKGCNTQTLQLGATNKAKLTANEISKATNKGWTVS